MEVRVGAHVLGIVGPLMRILELRCSHHGATCMITWREPIFQTPASSVICNPRSSDWVPLWQMLFTAVVLVVALIWTIFAWVQKRAKLVPTHTNDHMQWAPLCQLLQPLQPLTSQAGQRFTERENIWLSSNPARKPVSLFSALTWECAETYELLHNYM